MPNWSRRSLLQGVGAAAAVSTLGAGGATANEQSFAQWLVGFRRRAQEQGVSARLLDQVLKGIKPIDRVIELDRRQPEGRMTFQEYRGKVVSDLRVRRGIELYGQNRRILEQVKARYGVQPHYLVALWGIESSFGEFKGKFDVIPSLATLAWEGRRASFFEKELISALKIIQQGHVTASGMFGSWAGALGQCQFMPSTFLAYAVDFDGDGKRDIWRSLPDVFGSMANYLAKSGWRGTESWGREVQLPAGANGLPTGLDRREPLAQWQRRGLRRADGGALPVADMDAALIQTDDGNGPSYLVYQNFRTTMIWNRSTYFALSVGLLADELAVAAS